MTATPLTVFVVAGLTALATGLGALPFLFLPRMSRTWLAMSNAVAAGLMIAASFGLIYEGLAAGLLRVIGGALLGVLFIAWSTRWLDTREALEVGTLRGADAGKALMIIGIMTVHSFTEGVGVGVSFGGGEALGIFITTAIAVHNIPEGLAISLILVPRGESVRRAAGWSVFSSLPQPLLAVPAFLFVEAFRPILPVGLGFAAGAMIWMCFAELLPEALEDAGSRAVATTLTAALMAMIGFQWLLRG
ncbi:MAG: ZIP family metal transporter [Gemmatimonadetes bacterium]|uniref:ZIP family metal transporter n=1 Tax=Candidatus Kutchimonas denitrificans TaxID=3056748 RepID=A0AAE4ZAY1_9BACT|nr:ZIP family metal transporter [Gemmatimonadota bacterium]NIR74756.1 ZIP family metal transporter [Candidatus Kutchimonas denitrificans]NIS01506.1 ZIP family metal transporter [Gemmatimonadota bacterium]NIT67247.1 ZIP family metal transporter [Gemmatimonadota bacterium]NIU52421.1 ZIP family metal transporter [Gemmatimonadota bacterium]